MIEIQNKKLFLNSAPLEQWKDFDFKSVHFHDGVYVCVLFPKGEFSVNNIIGLSDNGIQLWTIASLESISAGTNATTGFLGVTLSSRFQALCADHPQFTQVYINPKDGSIEGTLAFMLNHRRLKFAGHNYPSDSNIPLTYEGNTVMIAGKAVHESKKSSTACNLKVADRIFMQIVDNEKDSGRGLTTELREYDLKGNLIKATTHLSYEGIPHNSGGWFNTLIAWDIDRNQLVFYFDKCGEVLMDPVDFKWIGPRPQTVVGF
jgi:hypothetical protein